MNYCCTYMVEEREKDGYACSRSQTNLVSEGQKWKESRRLKNDAVICRLEELWT
jgi:hypothetical protein